MLLDLLRSALERRNLFLFQYDGMARLVEPHALGTNRKGELILRAYQVKGDSATSPEGWKLFTMEKVTTLEIVDGVSQAPRPGYKTGDGAMVEILAELPMPEITEEAA